MLGDVRPPGCTPQTPQMFSLDFSDTLSHHAASAAGGHSCLSGMESISATLQLFELCGPQEGATIAQDNLERVLQSHLHLDGQADVARLLSVLGGGASKDKVDFLSYWRGMDHLFNEAGDEFSDDRDIDTVVGMRRFRDGVLAIHAEQLAASGSESICTVDLCRLLSEIRDVALDQNYWDEVMTAVPNEEGFSLMLPEVAEAVWVWLKDFVEGDLSDEASLGCDSQRQSLAMLLSAGGRRSSVDAGTPDTQTLFFADPLHDSSYSQKNVSPAGSRRGSSSSPAVPRRDLASAAFDEDLQLLSDCSGDYMQAQELIQVVVKAIGPEDDVVQQALSRLSTLHEMFRSTLSGGSATLDDCQKRLQQSEERFDRASAELAKLSAKNSSYETRLAREQQCHQAKDRCPWKTLDPRNVSLVKERDELSQRCSAQLREISAFQEEHKELHRKSRQVEDRCTLLEASFESGDGQVRWFQGELARLRRHLLLAKKALRSYADCSSESDEAAFELQLKLRDMEEACVQTADAEAQAEVQRAAAPRDILPLQVESLVCDSQESVDLETQLRVQDVQLKELRVCRDDLLVHRRNLISPVDVGDTHSPREDQTRRQSEFLCAQLKALQQYVRKIEGFLDTQSSLDSSMMPEKRPSLASAQIEASTMFNELTGRLQTLEVQKADVDQELRRLQQRVLEKDTELLALQRAQDQLSIDDCSTRDDGTLDGRMLEESSKASVNSSPRASDTKDHGAVSSKGIQLFGRSGQARGPGSKGAPSVSAASELAPSDLGFLTCVGGPPPSELSGSPLQYGVKRVNALNAFTRGVALYDGSGRKNIMVTEAAHKSAQSRSAKHCIGHSAHGSIAATPRVLDPATALRPGLGLHLHHSSRKQQPQETDGTWRRGSIAHRRRKKDEETHSDKDQSECKMS